jgi:membrane protein YqaA with SNARE-associated domain
LGDSVNFTTKAKVMVPGVGSVFTGLRRLYDWTLSWADGRFGPAALSVLAFTESSFFPIPPDPLLMALALGKPRRSFWLATLCTVSSVLGALLGYLLGMFLWQSLDQFFFAYVPGFTEENFRIVQTQFEQNAFLAIFAAAFTPIPYKVFTVGSGVFGIHLGTLVVASGIGRGLRFYGEAALLWRWGPTAKGFIDRYFNLLTVIFFLLLLLGFWAVGRAL